MNQPRIRQNRFRSLGEGRRRGINYHLLLVTNDDKAAGDLQGAFGRLSSPDSPFSDAASAMTGKFPAEAVGASLLPICR